MVMILLKSENLSFPPHCYNLFIVHWFRDLKSKIEIRAGTNWFVQNTVDSNIFQNVLSASLELKVFRCYSPCYKKVTIVKSTFKGNTVTSDFLIYSFALSFAYIDNLDWYVLMWTPHDGIEQA